jgi:hypothetical protein
MLTEATIEAVRALARDSDLMQKYPGRYSWMGRNATTDLWKGLTPMSVQPSEATVAGLEREDPPNSLLADEARHHRVYCS